MLHPGCASAILTPRGHPCLDVAQGQHVGTRLFVFVCFAFLIQKPMGSGSQGGFVIALLLWSKVLSPWSLLPRHQGKIYETERSDEKTLPLWL